MELTLEQDKLESCRKKTFFSFEIQNHDKIAIIDKESRWEVGG